MNYEPDWYSVSTTHTTTMGPQNIPTVRRWLRKNTNINFSSLNNLVGKIPGFGSLGFGKWFKLADDPHLWNLWRKDVRNRLIIVLLLWFFVRSSKIDIEKNSKLDLGWKWPPKHSRAEVQFFCYTISYIFRRASFLSSLVGRMSRIKQSAVERFSGGLCVKHAMGTLYNPGYMEYDCIIQSEPTTICQ